MKLKKTEKANLETRRPTLLLIGLGVSVALALESFEWSTTDFNTYEVASVIQDELHEEVFEEVKIFRPQKQSKQEVVQTNPEEVLIVKEIPKVVVKKAKKVKEFLPDMNPDEFFDDGDDDFGGEIFIDDEPYTIVEEMPEFPGGEKELYKYLGSTIQYPSISSDAGSQGQAYVNFTIEKNGSITDVKILGGSADKYCKAEAQRVVKSMPKWKAGKQRGKKVRVSYTLPIRFTLN